MYSPGNKLNRSCSESDLHKVNFDNLTVQENSYEKKLPIVRKRVLIVEETIHGSSPGLFRSSSCGRSIPGDLHNLQSYFSTSLVLNTPFNECDVSSLSLNTQLLKSNLPKVETNRNYIKNEGIIPMEVDSLNDSLKSDDYHETVMTERDMNIDPDRFTVGGFSNLDSVAKRYSCQRRPTKNVLQELHAVTDNKTIMVPCTYKTSGQKKKSQLNFVLILSVFFLLMLLYAFFIQGYIDFVYVNSDVQLENIQTDLLEKVHKQKTSVNVVNVVVRSLEKRAYWSSKIKVLGFIGSTGVGKTFVANIIKKHFRRELIHELYGIQLSYKSQWEHLLTTLAKCCLNLIIIDDLKRKDLTNFFGLIHSLPQDQFILVISIFNIQYFDGNDYTIRSDDITLIRDAFDNSGLYYELILFKEFNIDEVKHWIEEQLKLKNVEYYIQEEIMKTVLEGHIVQYQGLKGLYSKILLELEKYK